MAKAIDISMFKVFMPESVLEPLAQTLLSGYITQGKKVDEFEQQFGEYIGNKHVVSVNSGTSALTLALRLCNIEPGDLVITTAMTCTATNLPILQFGAKPLWADINILTGNIDAESVEKLCEKYGKTGKLKAIMVVDWGGTPYDYPKISAIAKKYNLKIIEDAAHALGASIGEVKTGNHADFTCFSFQAIKHITTVDGGALICRSEDDYKRARDLRWFGINRDAKTLDSRIDQDITDWGYKMHMNDVTATIGLEQLKYLPSVVDKYQANAMFYMLNLDSKYGRVTDAVPDNVHPSYWFYTILLPEKHLQHKFKAWMADAGVEVSQVHKRNDAYTVFAGNEDAGLHNLNWFSERMMCLPCHYALEPHNLLTIISAANEFARYIK